MLSLRQPTPEVGCGARRRGFSLIELMVVVVIIGLMSGIAMVSWEALFPNQQFNSAVRKLSDVLHATRSEAIARNHEFAILYNIDDDIYRVRTPFLKGGGIATAHTDDVDERLFADVTNLFEQGIDILSVTIDDETYHDGEVEVRFDPLGAGCYHSLVGQQTIFERTFTIEVLPLTGDIRFFDGVFKREPAEDKDFE